MKRLQSKMKEEWNLKKIVRKVKIKPVKEDKMFCKKKYAELSY